MSGAAHVRLRVLVSAPLFPPAFRGGGPIRTLAALVETAPHDVAVAVVCGDRDLGAAEPLPVPRRDWLPQGRARIRYVDRRRPDAVLRALASSPPPDVVYVNGLFDPVFSMLVRAWARRRGLQVLLAPRGELAPAALAIRGGRKRAFLRVAAASGLDAGVVWHASSERESRDIRAAVGDDATVLVREDDHALPRHASRAAAPPGPLRLVFVSRLVPNKGLDVLLEALALVDEPWTLDVHGIAEDAEHAERCRALAEAPGMRGRVAFHGPLEPHEVRDAFAEHDLFAFPTAFENFGHVIAEALSVGCPVLAPDTTPWTPRLDAGAGGVVDSLEPAAWADRIRAWASADATERTTRREAAADAYDRWRDDAAPHVLAMLRDRVGGA
ncbi:glycosyltransferase [Agrococcus jejuensis]|uniref:glycosyltransferase n=1 Tax=Agrococcus jejuensis TaxID=399736 RepID=UPI0011A6FB5A|nr:glycosyltransferase [Agrococcus jejuensis]